MNNDNFVRQNLKNRNGACRTRQKSGMGAKRARIKDLQERRSKSKQAERRAVPAGHRAVVGSDKAVVDAEGYAVPVDDGEGDESAAPVPAAALAQDRAQTQTGVAACAASSRYGLDPLQLSLDALVGAQATDSAPSSSSSSSSSSASSKHVHSSNANDPKRRKPTRHSGRYGGFDDAVLEAEDVRPACSGHQLPAKLIAVRKAGPNRGRRFYGCAYPADQRCQFFMWAEDNPNLIALVLAERTAARERDHALGPEAAYRAAAVRSYCDRLAQLSVPELKEEVRRCMRRRKLGESSAGKGSSGCGGDSDGDGDHAELFKLTVGGSRAVLLALLEREAVRVMATDANALAATDQRLDPPRGAAPPGALQNLQTARRIARLHHHLQQQRIGDPVRLKTRVLHVL